MEGNNEDPSSNLVENITSKKDNILQKVEIAPLVNKYEVTNINIDDII